MFATMSRPEPITDESDEVLVIINALEAGELGLAQADDKIMIVLRRRKKVVRMTIHCTQLGFDPTNKDLTGGACKEIPFFDVRHCSPEL